MEKIKILVVDDESRMRKLVRDFLVREDYEVLEAGDGEAALDMTLTAPNCPAADFIMEDIRQKVESVEGVNSATINLVFEPEWDKDMMSEEAKLELGFL